MNASAEHPLRRSWTRFGRARAGLVAFLLACGFLVVNAPTVNAAALTTVSWSVSNNQVSATNVTYTYSFKTATAGTIKTITFAVSGAGLGGAPAIAKNYGIGAGTVARAGQTITYTVTAAVAVVGRHPDLHRVLRADQRLPGGRLHDDHHDPDRRSGHDRRAHGFPRSPSPPTTPR